MNAVTEICVVKRFNHPVERVFDAFLDPARVGEWLFRTDGGVMERTDFDPRPGGRFAIFERRGEELAEHYGEFLEIVRPERIVFDFHAGDAPSVRITVAFAPVDLGCEVTLSHALPAEWADYAERTRHGWSTILDNLEHVMGTPR